MPKKVYIAEFKDSSGKRRRTQHATKSEAVQVEAAAKLKEATRTVAKLTRLVSKTSGQASI